MKKPKTQRIHISNIGAGLLVFGIFLAQPVLAQTYKTWQNPDATQQPAANNGNVGQATDKRLLDLKDQLNNMIDKAERDRAADPTFLRDLRDLANSFDRPSMVSVLADDFADGDFSHNPSWTVAAGRYWIEKDWGLRNALEETKATTSNSSSDSGSNDAVAQIFGNILKQALGGRVKNSDQQAAPEKTQTTAIYTAVAIGNAFRIELDISSWVNQGGFILGPYQGDGRDRGYRLIYRVNGAIELAVKSRNGLRVIASKPGPFILEDSKLHTVEWLRENDGMMQISLDDKLLIEHRDLSFRDPFTGFGMATNGGDFIVKRVSISATP